MLVGSIKIDEAIVGLPVPTDGTSADSLISFTFPPTLIVGAVYKVNVYAIVDVANLVTIKKFKVATITGRTFFVG